MPRCLIPLLLVLFAAPMLAESQYRSGTARATLVELYTSEGCSSCPPADQWYSTLLDHPRLWQSVVPVAFHVDYWDYLGWPDRFSAKAYSERQRRYLKQGSASGVYTPGVFAAGQEWRRWRNAALKVPATGQPAGVLELAVTGDAFTAGFTPVGEQAQQLRLHIAVLGFGLETPVRSGENRGELLRHDFVVLGHGSYTGEGMNWAGNMPQSSLYDEARRLAVAAWVSPVGRQEPLQALGGWLPR